MTQTLHTPGPWHHFENCEGWTVAGHDNEVVAYCDHPLDDKVDEPSPAEANAQLIAAALDMLEALEAQEMAEADPEAGQRKGYFDHAREMRKAAIAKAKKGGAQ
jgi:hypothetical protein